jgi:asparagine synthase (glutamine-hydrolysing)
LVVEKGKCREERWYNFTPVPFPGPKEETEAARELLELYKGAVRRHLLSDVPVGILLSGGLDSGLLLALMNEQGGPWPAYTIGYGETFADDELRDAAETAALLGARHVMVRLDQNEFEKSLPKIVECLEEPVAASSIVPMYFVSQRARQDVKVALVGQGPDELFGGYKRHLGVRYGEWWRGLPAGLRSMAGFAVNRLPRNEMLKRGVRSLGTLDRMKRYQDVFSLAAAETIDGLFRDDILPGKPGSYELLEYWRGLTPQMEYADELGGFQLLEIRSSLPDELLMYADKLSMAHSLEVRVPYLDRTVVEYVQRLGANLKVRNGTRKWLHRQVCQNYLPRQILRRKKRGFAVNVVDDWFRSSVTGEIPDMLLNENARIFDLLKPEPVRGLLKNHQTGRQNNHKLLFSLVMLEQWLRGVRSDQNLSSHPQPSPV